MEQHKVVSPDEWLDARVELLRKEKEMTRLRDAISAQRRALPWVRIEKEYVFDAPEGPVSLSDLFDGRSQLIVKHYMMAPGQKTPCVGCAFEVDHVAGALVHLQNHDVSYAAVAGAPIAEIEAFRQGMGWQFRFVSSYHSDFNYDFNVSFPPEDAYEGTIYYNYQHRQIPMEDLSGRSVFYRNESGEIFHTYSASGRGSEELLTTYVFLDLTPKGRDENGTYHSLSDWVRPHDMYGRGGWVERNGRYHPVEADSAHCLQPK
jgi:predicted dithiol-disulfide oxidoreductase (DUF899 family)